MDTILLQLDGCIARITLNRPRQMNALNRALLTELEEAVDTIADTPGCRCVIITGAGDKAFAAGADTKELETLGRQEAEAFSALGSRVFSKIQRLSPPVIAAVNGFALGGGCELALACDMRLASVGAVFGLPETTLGIFPGFGGTQRLPNLIGHGQASALIFSGEKISAGRALEIGLVNSVVPQYQLMDEALRLAKRISAQAPLAVQSAKRAMLAGACRGIEQGLEEETTGFGRLFASRDTRGGIRAFNRKENYRYEGR